MKRWVFLKKGNFLFFLILSTVVFGIGFQYLSSKISIAFTIKGQECFPYKFWLIKKGVIPERGEFIAFKNPRINERVTWIKVISGKGGDYVETIELPKEERFELFIDEINKGLTVKGFAILHPADPLYGSLVFEIFEKDTGGRELPMINSGKIPHKKYFVTSHAIRSFDSRYWGFVDEENIIGKAYPLF